MQIIDSRLQALRALHATGTVTAAAAALQLTTSTVSQQLRQLANDLDIPLLEAEGRRVRLTPAAHCLLKHADVLYADWARASAELRALSDADGGSVRFTAVATALANLVCPAVEQLHDTYPQMTFEIREDAGQDRYQLLLAGQADIAVVIPTPDAPAPDDGRFEQHVLSEERQDLLVPPDHPYASRTDLTLRDAAGETWIMAGDQQDQHRLLLTACAAAGFSPRVRHEAVDWAAVAALVAHRHGIALFPRFASFPAHLPLVRVTLHGSPTPTRTFVACVRRGSARQGPIDRGLHALRQFASSV